jgi:hypothetical protein
LELMEGAGDVLPEGILNSAGSASLLARRMGMPQDASRRSGPSLVDVVVRQVSGKTPRQVDGGTRYVRGYEVFG